MNTQFGPVASLNPMLLRRPDVNDKGSKRGEPGLLSGDFTGFNDVKSNLVKQFERLEMVDSSSTAAGKRNVLESVESALVDALKLPPRLREQVLKTFLDKLGKTFPTVASNSRHQVKPSRRDDSAPANALPTVVDLARHLHGLLAPTGRRSPALSAVLSSELQSHSTPVPRWAIDFRKSQSGPGIR